MSLGKRLVLGALITVLVVSISSFLAADIWLRPPLERHLVQLLEKEALLIAETVASDSRLDLNETAHRLGDLIGRRVSLIDTTGVVLGDSDFDDASLALLDNHIDRPEIVAVRSGEEGVSQRFNGSTNREELKVVVAAWPGYVRVSAPYDQIEEIIGDARGAVLMAGFFALAIALGLAFTGERMLGGPLRELTGTARAVATRQPVRYPGSNVREIRELVAALRSMDAELKTRMTELDRARNDTETVLQSLEQGVLSLGSRGQVRFANEAARELLGDGLTDGDITIGDILRSTDQRELVERVSGGEFVNRWELEYGALTLLVSSRPMADGGAVVGLLDVSNLKRTQAVRRDFVANVSHELKTPLTSILGYSETLLSGSVDADTTARFLTVIHENSKRMQRMVDELLDLARIESKSWEPDPVLVSIREVGLRFWQAVANRAHKGVVFELAVEPGADGLVADPEALVQILTNLFDNAIRHTSSGRVTLSAARDANSVIVSVHDTGSGIASEHLPRLFERFYRADPARSRDEGGTGLGLAIVKHLVEAHGGTARVESALGTGTTISLSFPL